MDKNSLLTQHGLIKSKLIVHVEECLPRLCSCVVYYLKRCLNDNTERSLLQLNRIRLSLLLHAIGAHVVDVVSVVVDIGSVVLSVTSAFVAVVHDIALGTDVGLCKVVHGSTYNRR